MKCPLCKGHFESVSNRWQKKRAKSGICMRCPNPVKSPKTNLNGTIHNFVHCEKCLVEVKTRVRK